MAVLFRSRRELGEQSSLDVPFEAADARKTFAYAVIHRAIHFPPDIQGQVFEDRFQIYRCITPIASQRCSRRLPTTELMLLEVGRLRST
ncbi:unnamed protein product [Sympodiomycopsis kandeliae]